MRDETLEHHNPKPSRHPTHKLGVLFRVRDPPEASAPQVAMGTCLVNAKSLIKVRPV